MTSVLAVDDLKSMRHMMSLTLVDAGYRVTMAHNGKDALHHIGCAQPDVILADIDMPHMDGIELAKNIRANPALARIPIVLMSTNSNTTELDIERAKAAGANGWLCKPLDPSHLVETISAVVN
ncbi:MAG: response regulator [Pseudomonadota bacterium]